MNNGHLFPSTSQSESHVTGSSKSSSYCLFSHFTILYYCIFAQKCKSVYCTFYIYLAKQVKYMQVTTGQTLTTVKPVLSGHPLGMAK